MCTEHWCGFPWLWETMQAFLRYENFNPHDIVELLSWRAWTLNICIYFFFSEMFACGLGRPHTKCATESDFDLPVSLLPVKCCSAEDWTRDSRALCTHSANSAISPALIYMFLNEDIAKVSYFSEYFEDSLHDYYWMDLGENECPNRALQH